jgi:radical SAM superfamily enzyme YgiQ (UPF0313 family)
MARIGLIQIDGKMPNLALMKLAQFHKEKGDDVRIVDLSSLRIDKWYGSKIFMGGSGYDIKQNLPAEIEALVPDYDKFNIDYSLGFTSRGCIRDCGFCIVREKEGIQRDVDMSWIKNEKVILWDNNFLASPNWKEKLQYFIDNNLKVSFNQGLDIRLIDDEKAEMLSRVKYYDRNFSARRIYFAFDNIGMKDIFIEKINILKKYIHSRRIMVYFIVGFDSTFEEDLERLNIMKELNIDPFAMPYNNLGKKNKKLSDFCRWVNWRIFKQCEFEDYKGSKLKSQEKQNV